ncbi:murein biosynthesis integral membrane protein MurJ [Cellulomonas alba]|uniref:Murein biosynthesis integral membrane protein MurJ n=1 Tax=Cellulomonas alba TaxID=3053467 RepID=A0ABT7SFP8_9CELL|nr:murein biosynthesis integral membrane protein MurJ [Cellulomonas alba]MDM7855023.1 murein biosynthesis integral membrane protein MurJ [Cellulomonas alba]
MTETPGGARALRRASALMASGTATSRALGLLRGMVLVAAIGATGQAADAFAVANKLPNVLYLLLAGGALNSVLVPQVVRAYRQKIGQEYVDRLLTLGFGILALATLLLTMAAPLLVRIYADPCSSAQLGLATAFAFWCIPQLFFYGVSGLLGIVLNARGSFGPYMWAPVVNNIVSIAGFGVFIVLFGGIKHSDLGHASQWGGTEIAVLAGGATLGVIAQALILLPALRAAGVFYRPRFGVRGVGLSRAGTVGTWTLVGLAVGQLGYIVVSRAASAAPGAAGGATGCHAGIGGIAGNAAYDAAFLIFILPHSLVTVSLATALFTRLAEQAHDGDVDGARATLSYGVRVVGLFTVIATAVVVVLARPVTDLVLWTAAPPSVNAVAGVVVTMMLGLAPYGVWSMFQRAFYAYEDARTMVPIQVGMCAVVVAGTLLSRAAAPPRLWVAGAGLSMSVSYLVGGLWAGWLLRRRLGTVDGPRILRLHVQATVAALFASLVGLGLLAVLRHALRGGHVAAIVECAAVGTLMCVLYVGALRAMRVREIDGLVGPLLRLVPGGLRRGGPSSMRPTRVQVGEVPPVSEVLRGTVLAGRYRVLDPLPSDLPGSSLWTAGDQILDRTVQVRVLEGGSAVALDAARRAALVTDPRLVRVLDVGTHEGLGYVVTEQVAGLSLGRLAQRGPLTADQARAVVGEAAGALEVARRRGVHHLALRPAAVHVGGDGRVLVSGLALDAAVLGTSSRDARLTSRADAVGLVRLLYAALTGYWPADPNAPETPGPGALPAAPTRDGLPVPPAELVADVPNDLDTLCAVTLGRHEDGPHTPGELVDELAPWGEIQPTGVMAPSTGSPEGAAPAAAALAAAAPGAEPEAGPADQPVAAAGAVAAAAGAAAGARTQASVDDDQHDTQPVQVHRQSVRSAFDTPGTGTNRPGTPPPAAPVRTSAFGTQPLPAFPPREPVEQQLPTGETPFVFEDVVRSRDDDVRRRRFDPTALVLVLVALVVLVGVVIAGKELFSSIEHRGSSATHTSGPSASATNGGKPSPTTPPAGGAAPVIASATTYDPSDTDGEHEELVKKAIDDSKKTAWYTLTYKRPDFSGIKSGVALTITLDKPATVSKVTLVTKSEGGDVKIRAGSADKPKGGETLAHGPVSGTTTFTLSKPTELDSVTIWIDELPQTNGANRLEVYDVQIS